MDGLRWLLLIFGLFVVAGVYFYTRYQRQRAQDSPQQDLFAESDKSPRKKRRTEPVISEPATPNPEPGPVDAEVAPPQPQKIVTLRIVAHNHGSFAGDELVLSLRGIGMRHGKFGIFHRHEGSDDDQIVFSAASLVEPGSFDLKNIREQEIPGVSLFMVLPGPIEGAQAFDQMIAAARALAHALDGELLDESGSSLSIQRERYMREEIIQYEHSMGMA